MVQKLDNKILCEDRCETFITSFEDLSDAVSEVLEFLSAYSLARTSGPSILLIENPMKEKTANKEGRNEIDNVS